MERKVMVWGGVRPALAGGGGLMRVGVVVLSVTNFSGTRVLLGHLSNLATAGRGRHSFHVFHHSGNRGLRRDLGDNVEWIECAGAGTRWPRRLAWQSLAVGSALPRVGAQLLLSSAGPLVPGRVHPVGAILLDGGTWFGALSALHDAVRSIQIDGLRASPVDRKLASARAAVATILIDRHGASSVDRKLASANAPVGAIRPHGARRFIALTTGGLRFGSRRRNRGAIPNDDRGARFVPRPCRLQMTGRCKCGRAPNPPCRPGHGGSRL